MSGAHTPGPWGVEGAEVWATQPFRFNSSSAGTPRVAVCDQHRDTEGGFPWQANARLIAAAPELLNVLQAIEAALSMGYEASDVLAENSPIRAGVRDAIAKATGAQS